MVSFLKDNAILNYVARSSASSPFPVAFYSGVDGEFWARKSEVVVEDFKGNKIKKEVDSSLVQKLDHPYFIRITYAYPFVFSDSIDEGIWRKVLNQGICQDEKIFKIFNIEKIKKITITSKDKTNKNSYNKKIEHVCGRKNG